MPTDDNTERKQLPAAFSSQRRSPSSQWPEPPSPCFSRGFSCVSAILGTNFHIVLRYCVGLSVALPATNCKIWPYGTNRFGQRSAIRYPEKTQSWLRAEPNFGILKSRSAGRRSDETSFRDVSGGYSGRGCRTSPDLPWCNQRYRNRSFWRDGGERHCQGHQHCHRSASDGCHYQ